MKLLNFIKNSYQASLDKIKGAYYGAAINYYKERIAISDKVDNLKKAFEPSAKTLSSVYDTLSLYLTPRTYVRESEGRYYHALEHNIRTKLLDKFNALSHGDKKLIFGDGDKVVERKDLTRELFEKILCPERNNGTAFIVDQPFDNSKYNSVFERIINKDVKYVYPKNVTFYETEEKARAAKALLTVLADGASEHIYYEKIDFDEIKKQYLDSSSPKYIKDWGVKLFDWIVENKPGEKFVLQDDLKEESIKPILALIRYLDYSPLRSSKELGERKQNAQDKFEDITPDDKYLNEVDKNFSHSTTIPTFFQVRGKVNLAIYAPKKTKVSISQEPYFENNSMSSVVGRQAIPVYMQNIPGLENVSDDGRVYSLKSKFIEGFVKSKVGKKMFNKELWSKEDATMFMRIGRNVLGPETYETIAHKDTRKLRRLINDKVAEDPGGFISKFIATPAQLLIRFGVGTALKILIHPVTSNLYKAAKNFMPYDAVKGLKADVEEKTQRKVDGEDLLNFDRSKTRPVKITATFGIEDPNEHQGHPKEGLNYHIASVNSVQPKVKGSELE